MSALFLILALFAFATQGAVTSVSVSFDQNFEAPRWMYQPDAPEAKAKGGELIALLVKGKKSLKGKDRGACIAALQKAVSLGRSLSPWIYHNQIQCALLPDKKNKPALETLSGLVVKIESHPRWMLTGASAQALRQSFKAALLALLDGQARGNRAAAWKTLERLKNIETWLTSEEKAQMYRSAGEMAFVEQNLSAAQDFFLRSLTAKDSSDLRTKLESIRTSLTGKKKSDKTGSSEASGSAANSSTSLQEVGVSDQEKEIYARLTRAIDSQEYVSAVEDGLSLLEKFPGSVRSQDAAEKVLDIYLSIANRTEEKFRNVRERVVGEMERGDADRLYRWANNAFARGNYADALTLAEKSLKKYAAQPASTKTLLLAGRAAYAAGEYSEAETYFAKLSEEHAGTVESAEAIFRLGLLEFRRENFPQSLAYFERVAALASGKDFVYRALYWQWRAQQKVRPEKASELAKTLIQKFPFTYYALRAQLESNDGTLVLPQNPVTVRVDLHLLEDDRLAWERALVLLKAGWFNEAQSEIDSLPEPQTAEERLVRAKVWAAAFRYDLAASLMGKSFEENAELAQARTLQVIYPREYEKFFARESKAFSVDVRLARALARQESSFRPDVRSPAGAHGVMQLMGPTAQEMAKDLRVKDFTLPDSIYDPEMNIKLGTAYFARLLKMFNGHVPLAIAAYNTGAARLKRWLAARKDLGQADGKLTSNPADELWIDELPWDETSFYVKAVLRNLMMYRLLDNTTVKFGDPIWRNE